MKERIPVLYWLPRGLTIAFALFISLFALDPFDGELTLLQQIGGFLIHLLPTAMILLILAFSWKREWIGALLFLLMGIGYIIMAWGQFPWSAYLMISGSLFLLAVLFWLNWKQRKAMNEVN